MTEHQLFYSMGMSGDLNLTATRNCYFCLSEALRFLKMGYGACALTVFCNIVAILFSNNNVKVMLIHQLHVAMHVVGEPLFYLHFAV